VCATDPKLALPLARSSDTIFSLEAVASSVYYIYIIILYLLTAIGLSPGGSTHLHTNNAWNNTNNNRTKQIITTEQHKYKLIW